MTEKKSSKHFEELFNFTRRFSNACGADVLKKNYKVCWKTVFVFLLNNAAVGLTFYTIYNQAIVKENYEYIFMSTSVLGTGLQGYMKLVNTVKHQANFRFLYEEISETYTTHEMKSSYDKYLRDNIMLVKKLLGTLLAIVTITAFVIIAVPIVMLAVFNRRAEVLAFQLPFLDEETDFGFYSKFCIQVVCVLFGAFGNFVIDSWLFIYVAQVPLLKNVLKCKFDDLNAILEEHPRNVAKSIGPLIDIINWHQRYNTFCDTIRNTFFWVIFVQISTEFVAITCTIVCIFLDIWIPAPAYLLYLFAIVNAYCVLGNLVEVSNDDIIAMIYDSRWYNMTVPQQKMILIMLRESQQATGISIGGVAPLSLNSALQLTKTIYTMSMMLERFFNTK